MDGGDRFVIVGLVFWCAIALGMTGLLVSCGNEINAAIEADQKAAQEQDVPPTIEHANGCPLDAVAYDVPAFADHDSKALKVTDRLSGQSWWLVRMGAGWIVLPIGSEEAGK